MAHWISSAATTLLTMSLFCGISSWLVLQILNSLDMCFIKNQLLRKNLQSSLKWVEMEKKKHIFALQNWGKLKTMACTSVLHEHSTKNEHCAPQKPFEISPVRHNILIHLQRSQSFFSQTALMLCISFVFCQLGAVCLHTLISSMAFWCLHTWWIHIGPVTTTKAPIINS